MPKQPGDEVFAGTVNGTGALRLRVTRAVDPHKLSATIEVLDEREKVLGSGQFGTDRDGYRQMLGAGRRWPDRVWRSRAPTRFGRHVAQRLVADGESVVDVPVKLCCRWR